MDPGPGETGDPDSYEVPWQASAERRELGAALRRLLDVVVRTGAEPDDLRAATEIIDELTERLRGPVVRAEMAFAEDSFRAHLALVGGRSHPVAPQLRMVETPDGAEGVVTIGPVFQGGPGLVHGGVLSLLIDHAMGYTGAVKVGHAAMTARLGLRYKKPTPLGVPLTVTVRLDRVEGRKLFMTSTISVDGQVTVESEAMFLRLTEQNLEEVFNVTGMS